MKAPVKALMKMRKNFNASQAHATQWRRRQSVCPQTSLARAETVNCLKQVWY